MGAAATAIEHRRDPTGDWRVPKSRESWNQQLRR
jgi:hypothetical protein